MVWREFHRGTKRAGASPCPLRPLPPRLPAGGHVRPHRQAADALLKRASIEPLQRPGCLQRRDRAGHGHLPQLSGRDAGRRTRLDARARSAGFEEDGFRRVQDDRSKRRGGLRAEGSHKASTRPTRWWRRAGRRRQLDRGPLLRARKRAVRQRLRPFLPGNCAMGISTQDFLVLHRRRPILDPGRRPRFSTRLARLRRCPARGDGSRCRSVGRRTLDLSDPANDRWRCELEQRQDASTRPARELWRRSAGLRPRRDHAAPDGSLLYGRRRIQRWMANAPTRRAALASGPASAATGSSRPRHPR